jgi:hypothetical protein
VVTNSAVYGNRRLMLCSESTTIIDASSNTSVLTLNNTANLSFINLNTPMVNLIDGDTVDFSNNQILIGNSIFEFYVNIDCSFNTSNNQSQGLLCVLTDVSDTSLTIEIDIRSISNSTTKVIAYGPRILIFDSGSLNDDIYKSGQYTLSLVHTGDKGSSIYISYPIRFVIKQKSLV